MPKYFLLLLFLQVFSACSADEAPAEAQVEETKVIDPLPTATDNTGELQGNWRSTDDRMSVLRFEGNSMIRSYDGSDEETGENFILGPQCPGSPTAATDDATGRYLSIPDAERCYIITKLTATELELSEVGGGDTLRYVRE
ncbi:hypothetical protein GGR28_003148 [Lewinella aquimaris]|uniref:Lipocalin-like domain-containing protein n=1 Tax=Neolewinella aquimaris TaxID=1835722 RepID=A0A840E4G5_9BACT|nr:hypothetical protein [Neolewinella aquimaris]MBB4080514.1 hypothetical protein [Neolewinella aquimaris]